MKKTARFLLLLFLLLLISIPFRAVFAADTSGAPEGTLSNQSWQCLETKKTGGHAVELSSKEINQFMPPGSYVYFVECNSTDDGDKCTTANEDSDELLFGNIDDLTYLIDNYQYRVERFTGPYLTKSDTKRKIVSEIWASNIQPGTLIQPLPVKSNLEGKIDPVTWESYVMPGTGHTFFGVQLLPEEVTSSGDPSLKLSTFYFANASEDCTSLRWDPYGRVFDSQSLEPISNVSITLYSKENNLTQKVSLPGVQNPQTTLTDGKFNFVVPDGIYLLKPMISSHSFPNIESKLHTNYSEAYWDIYRGEEIIQKGQMQHRDIPIDPLGAPYRADARILDYSIILDKLNSKTLISGVTSHPLSKIRVSNGGSFIKQVTASKFGVFDISLDTALLDPAQKIELKIIKTDLTVSTPANIPIQPSITNIKSGLMKYLLPVIYAQEEGISIKIDPILNNLEGYAYNSSNQPVPYATVSTFLESSQKVFSQTRADEKGYFNIPSQYLPPLSYYIQIKSPDGVINTLTTAQFGALNKGFAGRNSVNYGTYRPVARTSAKITGDGKESPNGITDGNGQTDGEPRIITTGPPGTTGTREDGAPQIGTGDWSDNPLVKIIKNAQRKAKKNKSASLIFILLLTTGAGEIFYLYWKKRKKEKKTKK